MTLNLKSRFFARFDPKAKQNDTFLSDMTRALELNAEQRARCLDSLLPILLTDTRSARSKRLRELEKSTRAAQVQLDAALDFMHFLLRNLADPDVAEDTPQQWEDDLVTMNVLQESDRDAFRSIAIALKSKVTEYSREAKLRAYATGLFPTLKSLGHTIELRAVLASQYKWSNDVARYRPEVLGRVPVVSFCIETDTGVPNEFYFQVDEQQLDYLIADLHATKKDLTAFEKRLPWTDDSPPRSRKQKRT